MTRHENLGGVLKKTIQAAAIIGTGLLSLHVAAAPYGAAGSTNQGFVAPMTSKAPKPTEGAIQELSWSPDGNKVVFTAWRKGKSAIFATDKGGQKVVYLTPNVPYALNPVWAPDGKTIYFTALKNKDNADICRVNADGKGYRCLTKGNQFNAMPAISPDGGTITFCQYRDGGPSLMESDRNGGSQKKFYDTPACFSAWSPDGKSVAFIANHQLILTETKTHKSKKVTNDLLEAEWCQDTVPVWSPKSNRVAFIGEYQAFSSEIYTISPSGKKIRKISDDQFEDFKPSWSADGKKVVFAAYVPEGTTEIFITDQDSPKEKKQLTKNHDLDMDPTFSPDGKIILFTRRILGKDRIFVMEPDGSNQKPFFKNIRVLSSQLDKMDMR
jgi:Tol biopolymer transport system component